MRISDWSSDVCSSDLAAATGFQPQEEGERTMAYTRYKGDPYWKRAKVRGTSADGTPYSKGDRVFLYPRSGETCASAAATRASAALGKLASLRDRPSPHHGQPPHKSLQHGYPTCNPYGRE